MTQITVGKNTIATRRRLVSDGMAARSLASARNARGAFALAEFVVALEQEDALHAPRATRHTRPCPTRHNSGDFSMFVRCLLHVESCRISWNWACVPPRWLGEGPNTPSLDARGEDRKGMCNALSWEGRTWSSDTRGSGGLGALYEIP